MPAINSKALVLLAFVVIAAGCRHAEMAPAAHPQPPLGTPGARTTSRHDLERTVTEMEKSVRTNPANAAAAVSLADALMRQTRVLGNPGLAVRAEQALRGALDANPNDYDALRMLATVLLSQHRFREAIVEANKAQLERPNDAWNYGVMGDAHIELGDYDEAFDAFDRMMRLRPSAAAYARASYARELSGDLAGALRLMQMSAEATSPQDPESQAWHEAQLGHLTFEIGRLADARRHYQRADVLFPGHPFAAEGLSRVAAAEGDREGAIDMARRQFSKTPTPELAVLIGDLYTQLDRAADADHFYALAESMWRYDMPQPAMLARFLADRNQKIPEAVSLARKAAVDRHDIFTEDALSWALFKAGSISEARAVSALALRTGTRDRAVLKHAAAIKAGTLR